MHSWPHGNAASSLEACNCNAMACQSLMTFPICSEMERFLILALISATMKMREATPVQRFVVQAAVITLALSPVLFIHSGFIFRPYFLFLCLMMPVWRAVMDGPRPRRKFKR